MTVVNIFRHIFGDDGLMLFQSLIETRAHFGGDFVGDVEYLPKIRIISFTALVMPQGIGILLTGPGID